MFCTCSLICMQLCIWIITYWRLVSICSVLCGTSLFQCQWNRRAGCSWDVEDRDRGDPVFVYWSVVFLMILYCPSLTRNILLNILRVLLRWCLAPLFHSRLFFLLLQTATSNICLMILVKRLNGDFFFLYEVNVSYGVTKECLAPQENDSHGNESSPAVSFRIYLHYIK